MNEDKIEVGEYVRTESGKIDKLEAILGYEEDKDEAIAKCEKCKFWLEDIVKHSRKIKGLIEEGDYVNGKLIQMNYETGKLVIPKRIKSIVTKEQFASVEYKVEED